MTSFKRTQRKDVQKAYRVRNWREYETGLRARGALVHNSRSRSIIALHPEIRGPA